MLATIVQMSLGSVRCKVLQALGVYLFAFFGFLVPLPGFFLHQVCYRQHLLPDGCLFCINFLHNNNDNNNNNNNNNDNNNNNNKSNNNDGDDYNYNAFQLVMS